MNSRRLDLPKALTMCVLVVAAVVLPVTVAGADPAVSVDPAVCSAFTTSDVTATSSGSDIVLSVANPSSGNQWVLVGGTAVVVTNGTAGTRGMYLQVGHSGGAGIVFTANALGIETFPASNSRYMNIVPGTMGLEHEGTGSGSLWNVGVPAIVVGPDTLQVVVGGAKSGDTATASLSYCAISGHAAAVPVNITGGSGLTAALTGGIDLTGDASDNLLGVATGMGFLVFLTAVGLVLKFRKRGS